MTLTNNIQLGRTASVFVKAETTAGTIAYPSAATDLIVPSGACEFNQQPSYTDSTEVRNSRSKVSRFADQTPAGTWSIPMYCRPDGVAGTKPDGHELLEAAFGLETVSAGSSVTYTPTMANDHQTLTIAFGFQDMVFAIIGATVNDFKCAMTNKGAINFDFSGGFMQMAWAGKSEIASASGTSVVLDDLPETQKFRPNMKIKFYDVDAATWYDNSAAGYTITAVDESTFTLTITPTISEFTPAADDIAQGWLPTGTENGAPIEARTGTVELDGSAFVVTSADVALSNNIKYQEDEISTQNYPTAFIADARSVTGNVNLFLRTNDLRHFRKGQAQTDIQITLKGGDTAGAKIELDLAQAKSNVPAISGDLEKSLALEYTALATTAWEDEVSLKFL